MSSNRQLDRFWMHGRSVRVSYIVFKGPVSELGREDVQQLPPAPSFFAVSVVSVVIWCYATEALLEVVWAWPWVAGRNCHFRRWFECIWWWDASWFLLNDHDGHLGGGIASTADELGDESRRGSQLDGGGLIWLFG